MGEERGDKEHQAEDLSRGAEISCVPLCLREWGLLLLMKKQKNIQIQKKCFGKVPALGLPLL